MWQEDILTRRRPLLPRADEGWKDEGKASGLRPQVLRNKGTSDVVGKSLLDMTVRVKEVPRVLSDALLRFPLPALLPFQRYLPWFPSLPHRACSYARVLYLLHRRILSHYAMPRHLRSEIAGTSAHANGHAFVIGMRLADEVAGRGTPVRC
jgi:hypothetical protein